VVVHSALPDALTAAVEAVLRPTALGHTPHGDADPVCAAERAAGDPDAVALIGPFRSADVAEAVEATAPRRLPLLAPVATWAGITRAADSDAAVVIVLCGLNGEPEIERARELAPLPIIAFDGIQGRRPRTEPRGPGRTPIHAHGRRPRRARSGTGGPARRPGDASERRRHHDAAALGPFDDHGDPIDPPVRFVSI